MALRGWCRLMMTLCPAAHPAGPLSAAMTLSAARESRPLVGSSRKSKGGRGEDMRPVAARCRRRRSPPDRPRTRCPPGREPPTWTGRGGAGGGGKGEKGGSDLCYCQGLPEVQGLLWSGGGGGGPRLLWSGGGKVEGEGFHLLTLLQMHRWGTFNRQSVQQAGRQAA